MPSTLLIMAIVVLAASWIALEAIRYAREERRLRRFASPSRDDRQFFRRRA